MEAERSESIKSLVTNIETKNTLLPEFQRDFVWEVAKTYELFDSLVKDIFIGAMIYGKPSFGIAVREIDIFEKKGKKRQKQPIIVLTEEDIANRNIDKNFKIILDGQQRSTAIYRALKGIDEVWFVAKDENDYKGTDEQKIGDKPFYEKSLEDILFEFKGEEDKTRLCVKLSDAYTIKEKGLRESKIKELYFDKQGYKGDNEQENDKIFDNYLSLVEKFDDLFKKDKLLSFYMLDMGMEKFTLFFERSNSRGISLNFTDILAAKLYAGNFNLREKTKELEDKYPNHKINKELITRVIAYLAGDGKEKIDKGHILNKLTVTHFIEHWNNVCDWYIQTLNFLADNCFIIAQSWMSYETMLVPLIIFRKELGKDFSQMTQEQSKFIHYWYWASIFSQRYAGASNETMVKDANNLRLVARKEKIMDKSFFNKLSKSYIIKKDDLYDYTRRSSAVYQGILNLLHYHSKGLIGWENTNKVNFNDSKLEDHHIIPYSFIKKKTGNDADALLLIDSVVNRTLIPKISNIKISDNPPSKYFETLLAKNPDITASLLNHSIPLEIMETQFDDYYTTILDKRAILIFDVLKLYYINKENDILNLWYKDSETGKSGNLKIFATYYGRKFEGLFDVESRKVMYKNKTFKSPSAAAEAVKFEHTGKEISANGWTFWQYTDENKEEQWLKKLQKK
jgi:hypothetical protein